MDINEIKKRIAESEKEKQEKQAQYFKRLAEQAKDGMENLKRRIKEETK